MNTLRKYLDIISESTLLENPWEGRDPAKAQAWAKLSPQVQQKLGGADPTDEIIIGRMVRGGFLSGKPVTDANPDGTAKTATPAAPVTRGMGQQPPGTVNPALQPAPLKTPSTGASADGNAGELAAQANASAAPAQAGQPVNRDSMTFGQAFKDARNKKEPKFTWKGKEYTTQLAPSKPSTTAPGGLMPAPGPKSQSGMPTQQSGSTLTPQQDAQLKALMSQRVAAYQRGDTAAVAGFDKAIQQWGAGVTQSQSKPASESVGYAEDQNLVSIVHLAGLR